MTSAGLSGQGPSSPSNLEKAAGREPAGGSSRQSGDQDTPDLTATPPTLPSGTYVSTGSDSVHGHVVNPFVGSHSRPLILLRESSKIIRNTPHIREYTSTPKMQDHVLQYPLFNIFRPTETQTAPQDVHTNTHIYYSVCALTRFPKHSTKPIQSTSLLCKTVPLKCVHTNMPPPPGGMRGRGPGMAPWARISIGSVHSGSQPRESPS